MALGLRVHRSMPYQTRCVGFHQIGIELMLADDLAKAIANLRSTEVPIGRLRRELLRLRGGFRQIGEGPDFLNRANANPVGLAEGSIHRALGGYSKADAIDLGQEVFWAPFNYDEP